MPRYTTTVSHALTRAEAVQRLTASLERARTMSDLEATWSGHTLTFAVTLQGLSIRGTMEVEDGSILLDCQLPLLAMAFKSWVPGIVGKALAPVPGAAAPGAAETDDEPTLLFLHIPKAAGTTFGEFLHTHRADPSRGADGLLRDGVLYVPYGFRKTPDLAVPAYVRPLLAREDLRAVVGHFWFGLHAYVPRRSTYVTVVRDPVERVLSLHRFLQLESSLSLDDFIASPTITEVDNDQVRRIAGVEPAVGACTDEMLHTAIAHLERHFSVVGVTERLDETMEVTRRAFGWPETYTPPRRNVTPRDVSSAPVTDAQREAIRQRNALDCRLHAWAHAWLDRAQGHARASASRDGSTDPASK